MEISLLPINVRYYTLAQKVWRGIYFTLRKYKKSSLAQTWKKPGTDSPERSWFTVSANFQYPQKWTNVTLLKTSPEQETTVTALWQMQANKVFRQTRKKNCISCCGRESHSSQQLKTQHFCEVYEVYCFLK